jgi:stearoyl-CoA desaturase (Delta-9 desaturase)
LSRKGEKFDEKVQIFIYMFYSYWPQYHYLLPFDYQSGEFGNYGKGTSTALCRVFAALGWISDLKTVTTDAVKKGLAKAVDTGRPVVDCLKQASEDELLTLPKEHYLVREHLD